MDTYRGPLEIVPILLAVWFVIEVIRGYLSNEREAPNGYVLKRSKSGRHHYEHREIAEQILGRRLEKWEIVHHINGRRNDNRPSNLCVMDSRDHDRYHEWYDWIFNTYGNYPRRETQLQRLRESFNGTLLADYFE
ncbi:MAG: HNH endonuclease [Bdellovibrio sp.]|nr:HNH endonuclease [Bdellovibrio sp.]